MRTIKIVLQYDGTAYCGWQSQPNGVTLQDVVQEKLRKIVGESAVLSASGRTDAGVHALAQVAAFRTESKLPADTIMKALNSLLPEDIRVMEMTDEQEDFHPRYDAKGKVYFYLISNTPIISPFLARYAWRVTHPLDPEAMMRAAECLSGTHDFSSFRARGCSAKSPVRTIHSVTIEKREGLEFMTVEVKGNFLKIRVEGNAFLRHMVRNIVGTLVEVGKGKMSTSGMGEVLLARDRKLAGPTAPARRSFPRKNNLLIESFSNSEAVR